MNNIQKAFKNKAKRGLRMASGGVTPGYVSSIPDMSAMRPPGMANTPAAPSPMLAGQRAAPMANNLASGSPAAPTGGPMPGQPVQSGGLAHQLGNQIAMGTAVAGLSNTDRAHLENPNNAKYGVAGPAPGSSAEASQMGQQLDIQKQLMSGLQAQGMADGGVAETPDQLMARMAAKYGGAPAPAAQAQAPAPVAPAPAPAPVAQAPKPAGGLFSNFNNLVQKHKAAIDAAGMADGGVANHMVYGDGPKGVDSVPAELAPGEGVIPAKMVDEYFGGPAKLEHLIESFTGKPTATRHGLRGQLHAAAGTGGEYPPREFEVPNPAALAAVRPAQAPVAIPKEIVAAPAAEPVVEPAVPGTARSYPNNYGNVRSVNIPTTATATAGPAAPAAAPAAPADMIEPIVDTPAAPAAKPTTAAPRRSIAGWVDKVKNVAGYGPENAAAPAAAQTAEPASVSAETSRKLAALTQDESFIGKAGRAADSIAGKARAIAPSAASLEALGTAGAALGLAAPALQNSLGEDRIKVDKENNTGVWDRAGKSLKEGAMNSLDMAGKVADSLASPISIGLNYANGKLGGNPNYFNEHNASDSIRGALAGDGVTAPLSPAAAANEKARRETARREAAPSTPVTSAGAARDLAAPGEKAAAAAAAAAAPDQRFTTSADQTRSIRSGGMSNQPNDPTFHRGTSATDATAMQAPDGGGYITNRAGKAMFVEGQKAPARDPSKTYDADGNDMTRTNGMKAQLAEMQKARFLSEATATNGAYHEGGKTGYAAMQAQDAVNLGNRNAATEEVKSKGLLAHYKQLEQQQAASLAMQRYGIQVKQRDDIAGQHKEYLDSQFINPADGKPMVAERTRFNRDLQHVMSSAGVQHPGDLTRKDLLEIQANSEAIQRKEKNNEGWGGIIEKLRGRKPRVGGNPLEQQFGAVTPGVFGASIKAGDGTTHYVSSIQGGGAMPWSGPIDSNIEGVLNRHSQR